MIVVKKEITLLPSYEIIKDIFYYCIKLQEKGFVHHFNGKKYRVSPVEVPVGIMS